MKPACFLSVLLIVSAVAVHALADPPSVYLVREGKPNVYIVTDAHPDGLNETVVNDFIGCVQRATGATLGREPQSGLIPLYIGEWQEWEPPLHDVPPLDKEEFELRVTSEGIWVLGGSPVGTSHGVYTLLRDLGFRWVMPGVIGECLPPGKDLCLPAGQRREQPAFSYRDIWYAYGCSPEGQIRLSDWLRRNRMYRPRIMHGHNLTTTLERLAPFEKRPDLYALVNGKRQKTQICTSNPEAVALVIQSIKDYMKANPDVESYSLCPDDNQDFCECDACTALDTGMIDTSGRPSVADRYQTFLNQVLEGLKGEYPNLMVTTYSYSERHTLPPSKTPVDKKTCIFATSSMYCSAHGVGDTECSSRQEFRALLEKWCELTPHVYIYEYDPVPYSGGLPWPMWSAHAKEMAVYRQIGVTGVSFEGQDSWAPYFPNYYVAAQFMWDPNQDENHVFEDMLQAFFGDAAPDMKRYYDSLNLVFAGLEKKVPWGIANYPQYFTSEVVERCRDALAAAESRTVPELIQKRIEMVRLSFDEMDAYLALRRPDPSVTFEQYKAQMERLNRVIDQMATINEDFLLARIAKEKTTVNLADRFAKEQGFVNKWLLCGPFDNQGMDGHDRVYPPEKEIDVHAVYVGKHGKEVTWKPNRTPEWTGYVDLLNEFDDTDWTCAYALCWVTVERGPKPVAFRLGSNDSVKVFLNGTEIWNNKVLRGASPDEDVVLTSLPEGNSTVLLKICQSEARWGFYFRITEPDSVALPEGVHTSPTPPDSP